MKMMKELVHKLCVCGLCLMVITACRQTKEEVRINEYEVLTVSLSDKRLTSHYSASLRGKQDVEIRPQVSGTITEVCVKEGAAVRKGEPLFIIDQIPYQAALEIAIANVKVAEANAATARLTAESKQELFNQQVVSSFEMQTAANAYQSQLAYLALAKAQEVNARNDLSYTVVKSPSDGIAGMIPYRVGALVSPSIVTPLTTISDNSEIYAYFSMTEKQILALSRQDGSLHEIVSAMPEVELLLSDDSLYPLKGKIDAISGIIDQTTGAISLRATFPNREKILHSGGSANIIFPYEKSDCIIIPQTATFEVQDKKYVYLVENGVAVSKMVRTFGINDGREYIIEEGLAPGEVIVAEGVGLLREGTPVAIKNQNRN
ncbi:membrane fusion protein (multidrug efflux system) [Parabacteroides sp. PF5-5]|nr:membrane fusion protein (multidrug efflux system) [Parabacteroides sp. PH5-39]MDH6314935.1 membrane fusion protein (multidrug efflux system) [Parabacteroides sp. PF5-13]MDH6318272.1 membrane fusion protein (multidrug efflux system) [Parabacteroides sp. PH5-13]MDH6321795.1 membrane fusion protein (multidrug efflux system) [Parabacteroides sp. PH5-8]MDH6325919.1 membrane fusion protein (multidrug efflux system) [Parabacteroides sp. PH5-41]MDH6333719.1 membrane fusion protein (multidrug efflux